MNKEVILPVFKRQMEGWVDIGWVGVRQEGNILNNLSLKC